jgi:hypothetical protein
MVKGRKAPPTRQKKFAALSLRKTESVLYVVAVRKSIRLISGGSHAFGAFLTEARWGREFFTPIGRNPLKRQDSEKTLVR